MKKLLSIFLCLVIVGCGSTSTKTKETKKKTAVSNAKVICIDPGHQSKQNLEQEPVAPGASETKAKVSAGATGIASKVPEYKLTLDIGLKLRDILKKKGYKVVMTRTTSEVNLSNSERAQIANKAKADAFIRIHLDGAANTSVKGATAVEPTTANKYLSSDLVNKSRALGTAVVNGVASKTGTPNRGIQSSDTMSGINWCKVPVTIIECGFLSNKEEDLNLNKEEYQTKVANGIAEGIDTFLK